MVIGGELLKLGDELKSAKLGDTRRTARAMALIEKVARNPDESFPDLLDDAELEALYRFTNNDAVTLSALSDSHAQETVRRSQSCQRVLVLHDTTVFKFKGDARQGLGWVSKPPQMSKKTGKLTRTSQGFYTHFSLVVSAEDLRKPLGVVNMIPFVRTYSNANELDEEQKHEKNKEQNRWFDGIEHSESYLKSVTQPIHVMDREGDKYPLLTDLISDERLFIVRSNHTNRVIESSEQHEITSDIKT